MEFRPIGWGGLAPAVSGVELTDFCEACGSTEYSGFTHPELLVDRTQWDGSDFFIVWPLPKFIFISARARKVILENGLSGSVVEPVGEMRMGIAPCLSPGKLEYWLPEAKVREIKRRYDGIE